MTETTLPPSESSPAPAPPPSYRLYGPGSVMVAALLGSPLGGAVVMALNYRRLGRMSAAWKCLIAGVAGTAALIVLAYVLPGSIPSLPIALGGVIATQQLAKTWQGPLIEEHKYRGGRLASAWKAAGIGLAVFAVELVIVGGPLLAIAYHQMGRRVLITEHEEIYCRGEATEADARRLGEGLKQAGVFGTPNGKTVVLSKGKDGTIVSVVVNPETLANAQAEQMLRQLGEQLAPSVGGKPLVMRFVNSELETKIEARIE